MTKTDLARQRLYHQSISRTEFSNPEDVVAWFGAVQAQDYLGALWAVGLRCRKATEAMVEAALNRGAMIRTWPMRGTLHFVAPADARWILKLLTPRIMQQNKMRLERDYELNAAVYTQSRKAIVRALENGRRLTRNALYQALENAKISTSEQRGLHITGQLAQEGLICFGPREGKQHTFVLLDEWIPPTKPLERDEAVGRLALRYFTSHGPATVQDFAWWSGLATTDAAAGLETVKSRLMHETIDGRSYWFAAAVSTKKSGAFLLPVYDEYTVAYKDRSAVIDPAYAAQSKYGIFSPMLVIDGQIAGTWKRTFSNDAVLIEIHPFDELNDAQTRETTEAANRFGEFL
jgi:hypothetical protein